MLCYYVTADSCSYIFWNLLSAAFPCLQPIRGWRVALRQTWWKTIKLCTSQIEDEGAESIDQGDHAEEALQRLVNCFARACNEFGLTISLKKTNIMDQNASHIPNISIGDYTLQVVDTFTCLDPTIASNLSLDDELNSRIGKTATAMARLARSAWNNSMLIINTKMKVFQACVLSTLLYGSETWTL